MKMKKYELKDVFKGVVDALPDDFYEKLSPFVRFKCFRKSTTFQIPELYGERSTYIARGFVSLIEPNDKKVNVLTRIYGPGSALCEVLQELPEGSFIKARTHIQLLFIETSDYDAIEREVVGIKDLIISLRSKMLTFENKLSKLAFKNIKDQNKCLETMYPDHPIKGSEKQQLLHTSKSTLSRKTQELSSDF